MTRWMPSLCATLLGALLLLHASLCMAAGSLKAQQQRYDQTQQQMQRLESQHQLLLSKVSKVSQQLDQLKRQAERGILGMAARVRLPNARAKAHQLGQQVEASNKALQQQRRKLKKAYRRMRRAYRVQIFALHRQWRGAKGARKQALAQKKLLLQRRYRSLQPPTTKRNAKTQRGKGLRGLRIDPLDGPSEIGQKIDALKDREDRVKRILQTLQRRKKKMVEKAKRQRRANKLLQNSSEMQDDNDMMGDEDHSPRSAGSGTPTVKNGSNNQRRATNFTQSESSSAQRRHTATDNTSGVGVKSGSRFSGASPNAPSPAPMRRSPAAGAPSAIGTPGRGLAPGVTAPLRPNVVPTQPLQLMKLSPLQGTHKQRMTQLKQQHQQLMRYLQQLKQQRARFQLRQRQLRKQQRKRKRN